MKVSLLDRLAVCTWSLQPTDPDQLLRQLDAIGIRRVQCALDPLRENPAVWGKFAERCAAKSVTFHAGFLPHDARDPGFAKLLDRMQRVADVFAARKIDLGLETGQESAETLAVFLRQLERPNVGVNFDPANMILYDKGDPIAALRTLAPFLKQCHLKDANRTRVPGTWGDEVPVGAGQVDWPRFFSVLQEIGFAGYCCFEREAGNQRVEDIRRGREFVESLLRAH